MRVLRAVKKRKKVRKLGAIDSIRREAYADLELDAKEDEKRVAMVMRIVEAGHGDKLVLASDFYRRTELRAEGGPGYAKTVTEFAPMLREAGLDEATVQSFIADNPRRWLTFTPTA